MLIIASNARLACRTPSSGGVFGLWSNEGPDDTFTQRLAAIFAEARAERVAFHNPLQNREFIQTIYLARTSKLSVHGSKLPSHSAR